MYRRVNSRSRIARPRGTTVEAPRVDHRYAIHAVRPYLQQISAFDAAAAGLKERDLQVMTQTSAPAFRVRLVGKDGGVKLDVGTPMTTDALFALIDAMPMRQDELSNR